MSKIDSPFMVAFSILSSDMVGGGVAVADLKMLSNMTPGTMGWLLVGIIHVSLDLNIQLCSHTFAYHVVKISYGNFCAICIYFNWKSSFFANWGPIRNVFYCEQKEKSNPFILKDTFIKTHL